jgi:hypothetical protein
MSNNVNDLREHLFAALKGLKDGTVNIEQAKAMSDVAQVIINSAKVEVDYAKATGATSGTGFLGQLEQLDDEQSKASLPKGITGVHVHRMR